MECSYHLLLQLQIQFSRSRAQEKTLFISWREQTSHDRPQMTFQSLQKRAKKLFYIK